MSIRLNIFLFVLSLNIINSINLNDKENYESKESVAIDSNEQDICNLSVQINEKIQDLQKDGINYEIILKLCDGTRNLRHHLLHKIASHKDGQSLYKNYKNKSNVAENYEALESHYKGFDELEEKVCIELSKHFCNRKVYFNYNDIIFELGDNSNSRCKNQKNIKKINRLCQRLFNLILIKEVNNYFKSRKG